MAEDLDAAADMSAFSADERQVIENTLRELAAYGGKSASEWSHEESAGWNVVREYGEAIDYASTFISTAPIPPEDLERARQFVHTEAGPIVPVSSVLTTASWGPCRSLQGIHASSLTMSRLSTRIGRHARSQHGDIEKS
jgi:hypothetical protein